MSKDYSILLPCVIWRDNMYAFCPKKTDTRQNKFLPKDAFSKVNMFFSICCSFLGEPSL